MSYSSGTLSQFFPGVLLGAVIGFIFGALLVTEISDERQDLQQALYERGAVTLDGTSSTTTDEGPLAITLDETENVELSMSTTSLAAWIKSSYGIDIRDYSGTIGESAGVDLVGAQTARLTEALVANRQECKGSVSADEEARLLVISSKLLSPYADSMKLLGTCDGGNCQNTASADMTTVYEYILDYTGASQDDLGYAITAVPNNARLLTQEDFDFAFDVCAVGGTYPMQLNSDWLVFNNSCGSGYDDGSGLPIGCEVARQAVESITIR